MDARQQQQQQLLARRRQIFDAMLPGLTDEEIQQSIERIWNARQTAEDRRELEALLTERDRREEARDEEG